MILSWLLLGCTPDVPNGSKNPPVDDPFGDHLLLQEGFFSVAHRGGSRLWPEHTLRAYGNALDAGADVLECDAHASSDGVVMCLHDANLSRTTDGDGLLKDYSVDELRMLDAGYWFEEGIDVFPYRGIGLQIPTLDEVLSAFPDTPLSIEIKQVSPSITSEVADLLDGHAAWDRSTLMSFFDTPVLEIREREPEALTALTVLEGTDFLNAEDDYDPPGHHLHAPLDFGGATVSQELVDKAHAHGIRVWMWTINDPKEMNMLLDLGVDGIFTDDPTLLELVR